MSEKPLVHFLCTGNSCRSQMAAGFGRQRLGNAYEVASARITPSFVHPLAVQVMAEAGVDISQQTSRASDLQRLRTAALVITLCGDAEERCPITPPGVRRLHWDDAAALV